MPNKIQDHVHRLIRSMTRAEKRYYKLHLARHGHEKGSAQEQLFDAVARMEHYDERGLLQRFAGAAFTTHFAITKRRLYESVLRCLESYHADCSASVRLNRVLHQVEILHQRALYDDAWKMLNSARRLAKQHELIPGSAAVLAWERRLIECRNYAEEDEATMRDAHDRALALRQMLEQTDELWHLKSSLFMRMYRQGLTANMTAQLHRLLDEPLVRDDASASSSKALFLRQHIRSAASFALGDMPACREALLRNHTLLQQHKPHFIDEPNLVLGVVGNLAFVTLRCGLLAEAQALLRAFRALPAQWRMPETDDLDLKLFTTTASLELSLSLRLGEVEQAAALLPMVERGLRQHEALIGPVRRSSLLYLMAYTQFAAGAHERALLAVNTLMGSLRQDDHGDVARAARLLQLMVFYETGKHDLLGYALRNMDRYQQRAATGRRIEPRIAAMVRELAQAGSVPRQRAALERFVDEASALLADPGERGLLDQLDPVAWALAKLRDCPLAAILRERAAMLNSAA